MQRKYKKYNWESVQRKFNPPSFWSIAPLQWDRAVWAGKIGYTISLYSESSRGTSLSLDANSGWLPVATIARDLFSRVPKPKSDVLRKWRVPCGLLSVRYPKKAALEVLFEPQVGKPLVFVLPWKDRSFVSLQTDRSNWFIPYNEEEGALLDSETKVLFRVVTEVGNEARLDILKLC